MCLDEAMETQKYTLLLVENISQSYTVEEFFFPVVHCHCLRIKRLCRGCMQGRIAQW